MRVEFLRNKGNPERATVATPNGEAEWVNVLDWGKPFLSFGQEYRHVETVEIGWNGYDSKMCSIYERVQDGCFYAIPWVTNEAGLFYCSESSDMLPVARKEIVRTVWETPWGTL